MDTHQTRIPGVDDIPYPSYTMNRPDSMNTLVGYAEYYYDPFGRRLWKDVGSTRTYFVYADEGLVAEYDGSGNELRSYGYMPDSTWTTGPLWLKQGGAYYRYQHDHLGTPQTLIDMTGTVAWSAQYTAFGEAIIDIETVTNNLRFPGQYYDAETGLHYNFQRYYDPQSGRYTQADPLGFAAGDVNWYAYVGNNPVKWVDPWGLQDCPLGEPIIQVSAIGLFDALTVRDTIAPEALNEAQNCGLPGLHNGPADAFRHCFWSCRMVEEIGEKNAEEAGDVHEECGNNPPGETAMDLHNNELGRAVARSGANCLATCLKLVNNMLQTSPGGTPPSDIY